MKLKISLSSIAIFIILAASIASAIYFFYMYSEERSLNSAKEGKRVIELVAEHIELPANEVPTIATVTDKKLLQEQEFFQKAENGDKILIYTDAKRAILYRPSANKIIDVVPVTSADAQELATQEAALEKDIVEPVVVVIYNGTKTDGATSLIQQKLISSFADVTLLDPDYAASRDYQASTVVAINEDFSQKAADIAGELGSTVGQLPGGESKPDSDILIIVGNDLIDTTEEE